MVLRCQGLSELTVPIIRVQVFVWKRYKSAISALQQGNPKGHI